MVLVMRWSVRVFNIPCCDGPRRLDLPFPVGDVFIADKDGNRFEDSIAVRWFVEDVDGCLIHLTRESGVCSVVHVVQGTGIKKWCGYAA